MTRVLSRTVPVEPYWRRVPGAVPLLHAISLEPDDDTAHLALADVCEEAGELGRAELIRLQRNESNVWNGFSYSPDERTLIDAHAASWLEGLPDLPGLDWRTCFFRGLLCRAELRFSDLLPTADAMFRAADIRRLQFANRFEDTPPAPLAGAWWLDRLTHLIADFDRATAFADMLAAAPRTANLRELRFFAAGIDAAALAAMIATGGLDNLRLLDLQQNSFGDEGCEILAGSRLRSLDYLNLDHCGITDEGVLRLCGSGILATTRELFLSSSSLTDRAVFALANALPVTTRTLCLGNNRVGPEGAAAIAAAPFAATLEYLGLGENPLGVAGIAHVRAWLERTCKSGDLRVHNIADDDVADLPSILTTRPLKELNLYGNPLTAVGLRRLASLDVLSTVADLALGGGPIGMAGLADLLRSPHLGSLARLWISDAEITGPFEPVRWPPRLDDLSLARNPLGDAGVEWLASCDFPTPLADLDLRDCGIGPGGVRHLSAFADVTRLDLSGNPLGDDGVDALADLPFAGRLVALRLQGTAMTWPSLERLLRSRRFPSLRFVCVADNGLDAGAASRLRGIPRPATGQGFELEFWGAEDVQQAVRALDPTHWFLGT